MEPYGETSHLPCRHRQLFWPTRRPFAPQLCCCRSSCQVETALVATHAHKYHRPPQHFFPSFFFFLAGLILPCTRCILYLISSLLCSHIHTHLHTAHVVAHICQDVDTAPFPLYPPLPHFLLALSSDQCELDGAGLRVPRHLGARRRHGILAIPCRACQIVEILSQACISRPVKRQQDRLPVHPVLQLPPPQGCETKVRRREGRFGDEGGEGCCSKTGSTAWLVAPFVPGREACYFQGARAHQEDQPLQLGGLGSSFRPVRQAVRWAPLPRALYG